MVTVAELKRMNRQTSGIWAGYPVHTFYLKGRYNADGSPVRLRASGRMRTWVTRPDDIEIPVKYGMFQSYTIGTTPRCDFKLDEVTIKEPKWQKRRR